MKYQPTKRRQQRSAPRRGSYRLNVRENPIPESYAVTPAESAPRRFPRLDHKTEQYTYPSQRQEAQASRSKSGSGKVKVLGRFRVRVADEQVMPGLFGTIRLKCQPGSVDLQRVQKGMCALLAGHDSEKIIGKVASMDTRDGQCFAIVDVLDFERSKEVVREIRSGARSGISPGLLPQKVSVDPDGEGSFDLVFEKWQPYEVSSTAIPRGANAVVLQELARR